MRRLLECEAAKAALDVMGIPSGTSFARLAEPQRAILVDVLAELKAQGFEGDLQALFETLMVVASQDGAVPPAGAEGAR
jgi:hypothetical protein